MIPTTVRSDNKCRSNEIRIDGMRVETSDKHVAYTDENIVELITRTNARIRLFGCGFTDQTVITFTKQVNDRDGACLLPASEQFKVQSDGLLEYTALVDIIVPGPDLTPYYFCVKNAEDSLDEKVGLRIYSIFFSFSRDFSGIHNSFDFYFIVCVCFCFLLE